MHHCKQQYLRRVLSRHLGGRPQLCTRGFDRVRIRPGTGAVAFVRMVVVAAAEEAGAVQLEVGA